MEFRETLLAAQRNQQHKSSESSYYKARFDPPKKEQKQKDKLSANIQKFLAKKDEEEKQKKQEALRKRDELLAMRDPKLMNKIKKSLKVFKSANKSVIDDAYDRDNTAVTLNGPDQPDQDDYGYESQEAAAIYAKMMQKYSKIPDEPKFPTSNTSVKKDLNGTRERVKQALQHEDDPVPHKRRRRTNGEKSADGRDDSPPSKYEPEKERKEEKQKSDKPKIRKPMPPPIDFNQLLKLAEQKKSEPFEVEKKKAEEKPKDGERLMTKRQKREYEEEMARRQRRQERLDAEKAGGRKSQTSKEDRPVERERKIEPSGFGRIPKLNNNSSDRNNSPRPSDKEKAEKLQREKDRARLEREKIDKERNRLEKEKLDRDKTDRDKLDRLKAERERIERDIERLNKDRERLERTKSKLENGRSDKIVDKKPTSNEKNIDLKSQNTYRIDKNSNDKKLGSRNTDKQNGHSSQEKAVPKLNRDQQLKNGVRDKGAPVKAKAPYADGKLENSKRLPESKVPSKRPDDKAQGRPQAGSSKPKVANSSNTFDFDKHVNSLKKGGPDPAGRNGARHPPSGVKRKPQHDDKKKPNRRVVDSDSEYDSEMDDFIDDGDVDMDYSKHIKEIFGYDRSRYRDMDDDDDPSMVSSFAQQQREEFISKKIGIMEDLEDMRMEAMEKKKSSKKRRISDD